MGLFTNISQCMKPSVERGHIHQLFIPHDGTVFTMSVTICLCLDRCLNRSPPFYLCVTLLFRQMNEVQNEQFQTMLLTGKIIIWQHMGDSCVLVSLLNGPGSNCHPVEPIHFVFHASAAQLCWIRFVLSLLCSYPTKRTQTTTQQWKLSLALHLKAHTHEHKPRDTHTHSLTFAKRFAAHV